MKTKHKIRKWLSVVLCVCMLAINIDSTAFADGEASVSNLTGTKEAKKTVLLAGETNPLRQGDDLGATIQAYRERYLLGIAADFSVFLEGNFTPMESDTEGRAAIGGDIDLRELKWKNDSYSYAIGAGDYLTTTPLDKLLRQKNGKGTATVILGGGMLPNNAQTREIGQISDVYYDENGNKYEHNHAGYLEPEWGIKSSKILVLNTNDTPNTSWIPEEGYQMDQSQTYVTELFRFGEQFDYLRKISSEKLPQQPDEGNKIEKNNGGATITFTYGGLPSDTKACVYFNLPTDDVSLEDFANANSIEFKNIPAGSINVVDRKGDPQTWPYTYIVVNIDGGNNKEFHISSNGSTNTTINGDTINDDNNHYGVSSLMYNIYNTDKVVLPGGNFQGTVFAPDSDACDEYSISQDSGRGHLSGALIAKSFKGGTQFGYYPYLGPRPIDVNEGNLKVSKTVTGNASDKTKPFTFTVTLSNGTISDGIYGEMEFKSGVATFKLKDGESKTATGLPAGITYTVEESDNAGYTVTSTDATGTIVAGSTAEAKYTNYKAKGDLIVSKTVTGTAGDKTKYFNFTVTLSDTTINGTYGDNGGMKFENGVATFTLKDGESKTATGLPAGITYTVEESDNAGYMVTAKGATGTIPEGKAAEATFTNHKDAPAGDLIVTKKVTGTGGDETKDFTFTVTLSDTSITGPYGDMSFDKGVATFTLQHGQSKKATGLPAGIEYTVQESDYGDYTVTVNEDKVDKITGAIENKKEAEVVFTNHRDAGDLTVSKNVTGSAGDKTKDFIFTVTLSDTTINGKYGDMTFTNGKAEFKLKHGQSKKATGLLAGLTYTVVESDNEGYKVTKTGETGTIDKDKPSKAEFTNRKDAGKLTVSKTVTGTDGDKEKDFTFTVTLGDETVDGTYGDMTFDKGVATFTLKDGQSKKATGLPEKISYTVVESDNEGYTVTSKDATGTIPVGDGATVKFVNTKDAPEDPDTGSLVVFKTVTGNAGETDKYFNFTVTLFDGDAKADITGTYGDMNFENGKASFTLKDGQQMVANGLPVGTTYTVVESDNLGYTVTSKNATGTIKTGEAATGEITKDVTALVEFINRKETGDLTVSKTVEGRNGDKTKDFSFTVTLSDKTITGTYGDMTFTDGVATFTLKNGGIKEATGLPVGIEYTVEESKEGNEGYTVTSTGATGKIAMGETATAAFTNTRDEGSLKVSKTVTGTGGDKDQEFTFTVTLFDGDIKADITGIYGDMEFKNGVAEFPLKHGESKTARELPTEITYTVEETDYEDYTMTKTGETGTIEKDKEAQAAFTNTRNAGNLTVSKTVAGTGGDKEQAFFFTVKLSDDTINGKYGDMTFDKGVAKFTLKHGESKTAKGLLAGLTYEVVEGGNKDYEVTSTGATGKILSGQTAQAKFTNSKGALKPGNLTVSKTVTGTGGDKDQEFTFTVTLSDTSINGTYGDMIFKNGVATFTLTHNVSKTATGLPEGITYKVVESDNEGYTVTKSGDTGSIPEDTTAIATFTNHKNLPKADLTVTETVIGDEDKDKEFSFTVTLDDDTINGTYGDMNFKNGKASFTLKDGESKTAKDLPSGLSYTVVQTDNEGYTQSVTGETGKILDGAPVTAAFINTKNVKNSSNGTSGSKNTSTSNNASVASAGTEQTKITVVLSGIPRTGDDSHLGLWIVLLTLALVGLGAGFYFKKKSSSR